MEKSSTGRPARPAAAVDDTTTFDGRHQDTNCSVARVTCRQRAPVVTLDRRRVARD
jgi:hypothetical protein